MRKRALGLRFVVGAMVAGGAVSGFALAQDDASEKGPEAPAREDEGEEDPTASIPQTRWLPQGQEYLTSMRNSLTKGLDELKEAREAKDAVQLTCVNEQVTAMKGLLRVSEDAIVALQESLSTNDSERARYEFRKIHVSKRKMDDLLQAAVNCAGAESTETNTSVELEVDPSVANVDPYYGNPAFFFDPQTAIVDGDTGTIGEDNPDTPRPPPASGLR
jgi:hypothetical protein